MIARHSLTSLLAVLAFGAGASALAVQESGAQEARAAYAYVTANLNERAGPGTRFPSLAVIPARTQITINGCLSDLSWCEGQFGNVRGWMSGTYLRLYDYSRQAWVEVSDYAATTRLARYSFDLERYWTAHYADRPFYPQRAAWLVAPRSPVIDDAVFYRELSPYGRWVALDGRYVWMPQVERGWRPYADGRWEYTERYGWTWVSNEPFGWATYHYGRWAYSDRLGWVWVPGTQWAPAWVAWRGSEDHLAWAPLPPDAGPDFRVDAGYDEIPSYYWQIVPSAEFLLPNLLAAILGSDDGDRRAYLDRAQPIGNATVVNDVVVNNVVNVEYVEKKTRKKVVPREVVITNRDEPRSAASAPADDQVVRIYQPAAVEAPATETPPSVLPAEVAARQSQTAGEAGNEPTTDDRIAQAPEPEVAEPPRTEAPPLAADETPADQAPQGGTDVEEPPAGPPAVEPPADVAAPQLAPEVQPPEPEQPAPPPPDVSPPPSDQPAPAPKVVEPPADGAAPQPAPDVQPPEPEQPAPPPPDASPPPSDQPAPEAVEPPADEAAPQPAPEVVVPPSDEPPPAPAPEEPPVPPPSDAAPIPAEPPAPAPEAAHVEVAPPVPVPEATESLAEPSPPAATEAEAVPPPAPEIPVEAEPPVAPEGADAALPPPPEAATQPAESPPVAEAAAPLADEPPPASEGGSRGGKDADCPDGMKANKKGECVPKRK